MSKNLSEISICELLKEIAITLSEMSFVFSKLREHGAAVLFPDKVEKYCNENCPSYDECSVCYRCPVLMFISCDYPPDCQLREEIRKIVLLSLKKTHRGVKNLRKKLYNILKHLVGTIAMTEALETVIKEMLKYVATTKKHCLDISPKQSSSEKFELRKRVLEWYDRQPDGRKFTARELIKELGLPKRYTGGVSTMIRSFTKQGLFRIAEFWWKSSEHMNVYIVCKREKRGVKVE